MRAFVGISLAVLSMPACASRSEFGRPTDAQTVPFERAMSHQADLASTTVRIKGYYRLGAETSQLWRNKDEAAGGDLEKSIFVPVGEGVLTWSVARQINGHTVAITGTFNAALPRVHEEAALLPVLEITVE